MALGDFFARVLSVEDDAAIVDLGDALWPGDEDTHITQHIFSCDPADCQPAQCILATHLAKRSTDG